jgi:Flp pilus assembly protein TadD
MKRIWVILPSLFFIVIGVMLQKALRLQSTGPDMMAGIVPIPSERGPEAEALVAGNRALDAGDFATAEREFGHAIELKPGLAAGYNLLAETYIRADRQADAEKALQRLLVAQLAKKKAVEASGLSTTSLDRDIRETKVRLKDLH